MGHWERTQPTESTVDDAAAERQARLRIGTSAVGFSNDHLKRDQDTGAVMIDPEKPVTPEMAKHFAAIFAEVVATPELCIGLTDAAGIVPEEIIDVAAQLNKLAEADG